MLVLAAQITDPIVNQLLQPLLERAGDNAWIVYIVVSVIFYFISSRNAKNGAVSKAQEIIQEEFKKTSEERDELARDVKLLKTKLQEIENTLEKEEEEKRIISEEKDKLAEELETAQGKIRVLEDRLHDMEVSMQTQRDLFKDLINPLVSKLQDVLKEENEEVVK